MTVVSIIGPKGGIGKTTLSINTAAALTRALKAKKPDNRVCLVDLDLRLPTISSLLDSHPTNTFYDLFETLANRTYQVDFLRTLYQIVTRFQWYLEGRIEPTEENLLRALAHYNNLNTELFRFTDFPLGDSLYELFLQRGQIHRAEDIPKLKPVLDQLDREKFRQILKEYEANAWPLIDDFLKYIEEYRFTILGGEIPILGKKLHRKRINEPEFLLLFLDVLNGILGRFDYVLFDTPAGGVNHLSSLINSIDQVLFVFDLSNSIAINGSIDALHSFIDYYEDFYEDFLADRLTGLDKAYVQRLIHERGRDAILESLENKQLSIVFNRCQKMQEIPLSLQRLREYLDTLDKLQKYKHRIHIAGMIPHHKVINITNNRGALFYNKDKSLTGRMDQITSSIIKKNRDCPSLATPNDEILRFLRSMGWWGFSERLSRIASSLS